MFEHSFPWVVFIRVEVECETGDMMFSHCSGVVVSSNHVVTDAHCLYFNSTEYMKCTGISDKKPVYVLNRIFKD